MPYKDSDRRRTYAREWMRPNPDKAREAMRRWRDRHPSEHAASNRLYYERHKEELASYFAQYRREHRDVRQTIHARRRARKLDAEGSYTTVEWIELLQRWNWTSRIAAVMVLSSPTTESRWPAVVPTRSRTSCRPADVAISARPF
jgi:hypothetical protein